jgi:hypothetical protein
MPRNEVLSLVGYRLEKYLMYLDEGSITNPISVKDAYCKIFILLRLEAKSYQLTAN